MSALDNAREALANFHPDVDDWAAHEALAALVAEHERLTEAFVTRNQKIEALDARIERLTTPPMMGRSLTPTVTARHIPMADSPAEHGHEADFDADAEGRGMFGAKHATPAEVCGARAEGGPCVLPRAHNMGQADVPSNHLAAGFRRHEPGPVTAWEYGYSGGNWEPTVLQEGTHPDVPRTHRRRKAGPWEPVEAARSVTK